MLVNQGGQECTGIVRSLLRLGAFLQREGNRLLSGHGLSQQQFVVLKEIEERGPLSQKEICSQLLLEKSNVSKTVKKLVRSGLVDRKPSPDDNRISSLMITAKGLEVVSQCMEVLDQWNREWLKALSGKELEGAAAALAKLEGLQPRLDEPPEGGDKLQGGCHVFPVDQQDQA